MDFISRFSTWNNEKLLCFLQIGYTFHKKFWANIIF